MEYRECWMIGTIEFCANYESENRWCVWGHTGQEVIMEERCLCGTLENVKEQTCQWAEGHYHEQLAATTDFMDTL